MAKSFKTFVQHKHLSNLLQESNEEYARVFAIALKKWEVEDPSELSDEDKKDFFNFIDSEYESEKEKKGIEEQQEDDCGYADQYKVHTAQHPEQDLTENSRFYTKQFPSKHYKLTDSRKDYEQFYIPREEVYDIPLEPESDDEDQILYDEDDLQENCCPYASPEPDSAVGHSYMGEQPAKRIDCMKDLDRSKPNYPKDTYRLWFQYASGESKFYPEIHLPGLDNVEDLRNIPLHEIEVDMVEKAILHMISKEMAINSVRNGSQSSRLAEKKIKRNG